MNRRGFFATCAAGAAALFMPWRRKEASPVRAWPWSWDLPAPPHRPWFRLVPKDESAPPLPDDVRAKLDRVADQLHDEVEARWPEIADEVRERMLYGSHVEGASPETYSKIPTEVGGMRPGDCSRYDDRGHRVTIRTKLPEIKWRQLSDALYDPRTLPVDDLT